MGNQTRRVVFTCYWCDHQNFRVQLQWKVSTTILQSHPLACPPCRYFFFSLPPLRLKTSKNTRNLISTCGYLWRRRCTNQPLFTKDLLFPCVRFVQPLFTRTKLRRPVIAPLEKQSSFAPYFLKFLSHQFLQASLWWRSLNCHIAVRTVCLSNAWWTR